MTTNTTMTVAAFKVEAGKVRGLVAVADTANMTATERAAILTRTGYLDGLIGDARKSGDKTKIDAGEMFSRDGYAALIGVPSERVAALKRLGAVLASGITATSHPVKVSGVETPIFQALASASRINNKGMTEAVTAKSPKIGAIQGAYQRSFDKDGKSVTAAKTGAKPDEKVAATGGDDATVDTVTIGSDPIGVLEAALVAVKARMTNLTADDVERLSAVADAIVELATAERNNVGARVA